MKDGQLFRVVKLLFEKIEFYSKQGVIYVIEIDDITAMKNAIKAEGEKEEPINDGTKCACKYYPSECLYCHNQLAEDSC